MGDSGKLSAEQKQRIEANRLKALAKRAEKQQHGGQLAFPSNAKTTSVFSPQSSRFSTQAKEAPAWTAKPNTYISPSKASNSHMASGPSACSRSNSNFSHSNTSKTDNTVFVSTRPDTNFSASSATGISPAKTNAAFLSKSPSGRQRTQQEIDANRQRALALRAGKSNFQGQGQGQNRNFTPTSPGPQKSNFYATSVANTAKTIGANGNYNNPTSGLSSSEKSNFVQNYSKPGVSSHQPKPFGSIFSWQSDKTKEQNSVTAPLKKDGGLMKADDVAQTIGINSQPFKGKKKILKGTCCLISRERFEVKIIFHPAVVEVFKSMPTRCYDATTKHWTFKLGDYNSLLEKLHAIDDITIEPLPPPVRIAFSSQLGGRYPPQAIPDADLSEVDPTLVSTLMPFQREGISFGIHKKGRVLLADDMGLGKTIQGICLACYYRREWPVLVVAPSSVRFAWAQQFKKWVPSLDQSKIKVAVTGNDNKQFGLVHITSYDLLVKSELEVKKAGFRVIIMDESHFLKNPKTNRCQAALPILKVASRVILLSGTPALSRPIELFPQLSAIAPRVFKNHHEFGLRYCEAQKSNWGWNYNGSSNMQELQILLEESVMIRRIKADVLDQLPEKRREMIILDPAAIKTAKSMKATADLMSSGKLRGMERRGCLLTYFTETSKAKVPAVRTFVLDLLEGDRKFLVFAHHSAMLDSLEEAILKKGSSLIRIDGRTPSEQRKVLCDKFMFNEEVKVALLSITAASTGINLTAASLVVFAELFWNPGILTQAEDRVHRIGQRDSVNVQYLVAKGTADDYIWPLVQNKLDVLQSAGLTKDDFSEAGTTEMGVSKQDAKQRTILSYFEEDLFNQPDEVDDIFKKSELDEDLLMQTRGGDMAMKTEESLAPPPAKKPKMPSTILKDEFDFEKDEWWT